MVAMAQAAAKESSIPQQKTFDGVPFPLVLSPTDSSTSLQGLLDHIRSQKELLQSQRLKHGAILFRGFPINSPEDFNAIVEAFGFEELPYLGGAAPRTNVVGRVFTANESPPHLFIPFHHEMAQVRLNAT